MESEQEYFNTKSMTDNAGGTMDATVVVPLVIQLFGAIKLDLLWSTLAAM